MENLEKFEILNISLLSKNSGKVLRDPQSFSWILLKNWGNLR